MLSFNKIILCMYLLFLIGCATTPVSDGPVNLDSKTIYKKMVKILKESRIVNAEATVESDTIPFLIKADSFNESNNEFTGKIEWVTLSSVHKITGKISRNEFSYQEVEVIKKGKAGCCCKFSYTIENTNNKLMGKREGCSDGAGPVWINFD